MGAGAGRPMDPGPRAVLKVAGTGQREFTDVSVRSR